MSAKRGNQGRRGYVMMRESGRNACKYVGDLMRLLDWRTPPSVALEDSIDRAADVLIAHPHTQRVYVVDNEMVLQGAISERVLAGHVFFRGHEPQVHSGRLLSAITSTTAGHLMQEVRVTAKVDDTVEHVLRAMVGHHSAEAAVVDGHGKLIGDLTMSDLFRFCRDTSTQHESPPMKEQPVKPGNFTLEGESMTLAGTHGKSQLPVTQLPGALSAWLEKGRLEVYASLGRGGITPGFWSHHLPVVATGGEPPFAANMGHKGVGPVPVAGHLDRYLELYRRVKEETEGLAPHDRLRKRLEAVAALAGDREAVDQRCLGTLEIFRKRTYENLVENPFASLLFTGVGPEYVSFQLDCGVEVLGEGDPRYEFLQLARTMFERENFHITQPGFVCAYIFWISKVIDKTPHPVGGRAHVSGHPAEER